MDEASSTYTAQQVGEHWPVRLHVTQIWVPCCSRRLRVPDSAYTVQQLGAHRPACLQKSLGPFLQVCLRICPVSVCSL